MRAPASLPDPRLRVLRASNCITIRDLANRAGCSYRHLQMIELGDRRPSLVLAYKIADALSDLTGRPVSVDDFFNEDMRGAA